ncbi:hypothetical protein K492DRAFT_207606 [Lichtheimia hyalospora FSU 10163]|nr:hypothetical protein K492DRAFT_207606 [Lichtheimia hyalospora FSU 10163]
MGQKLSKEVGRLNLFQENNDYDHKTVRKLIRAGRLAAFYKGLNELPHQSSRLEKTMTTKSFFLGDSIMRHSDLYQQALECPICFLYFPMDYLNYSRCCRQPICTECFLRLRRSSKSPLESPSCPFCIRPDFGIVHIPPDFTNEKKRDDSLMQKDISHAVKSLTLDDSRVIRVDSIRPSWHKTILDSEMRMGNLSGKGTTRRRVVRPNNQNRPIGHLRPDESPYYGDHRVSWPNDHESVTVMHAIRSQQ